MNLYRDLLFKARLSDVKKKKTYSLSKQAFHVNSNTQLNRIEFRLSSEYRKIGWGKKTTTMKYKSPRSAAVILMTISYRKGGEGHAPLPPP